MRARHVQALLPLFLLLLLPALPLRAVSVYLERTARVGGEVATLGDIATVVAADPQAAEQLRALPLWRPSGKAGIVPAGLIRQRLAAALDGQAVVVGARTLILPDRLAEGAELEFYTRLLEAVASLPGRIVGRIEVELLSRPELPATGAVELRLQAGGTSSRAGGANGYLGGLYQVVYRVGTPGEAVRPEQGVGAQIRQYLPVAVAARDLPAGSVLSWSDLSLEEQDVGAVAGGFLTAGDRPEAFRTAAPFARGERIDPVRLQRHYLVRAGDAVTVIFLRPGLRVSLPGRAFSSGAAGDRVDVRPRDAARRFSGRVSPSGEVIVEEL